MISREALLARLKQITNFNGYKPSAALAGSKEEHLDTDKVLATLAEGLLRAISDSKDREYPDYITRVLNSPGFTIRIFSTVNFGEAKTALGDTYGGSGRYVGPYHQMSLAWPFDMAQFVTDLAPHEFWHAYKWVLSAKDQDVKRSVRGKSEQELLAKAPYDTKEEYEELRFSIAEGQRRITHYESLLAKSPATLTADEKSSLQTYDSAASVYVPRRFGMTVLWKSFGIKDVTEVKTTFETLIKCRGKLEVQGCCLYPDSYTHHPQNKDFVAISFFCVKDPRNSQTKGLALIRDTLYREAFVLHAPQYAMNAAARGEEAVYLEESDANIAVHLAALNKVFYPERNAYHKKRFAKRKYYISALELDLAVKLELAFYLDGSTLAAAPSVAPRSILEAAPSVAPRSSLFSPLSPLTLAKDEGLTIHYCLPKMFSEEELAATEKSVGLGPS